MPVVFGVSSARGAGGTGSKGASSLCQWVGMGFHVPQEHTWSLPSSVLNIPKSQEQQSAENTRGEHPDRGTDGAAAPPSSVLGVPLCLFQISQCAHRLDIRDLHNMSLNLLLPRILNLLLQILNM